jgi:hypothetical protein
VYNFEAGIVSKETHIVRPLEQAFDSVARQASLIDPHWVWKRISQLREIDDDRTYEGGKRLGWHLPGKEILPHVMTCEKECPQLDIALDKLFGMISEYQKQAA